MINIVSTRFNNETWNENNNYRINKNISCIYGSPQQMSPKIYSNSIVFVVEMNNTINQINGIGLVRNKPDVDKYYKIYTDVNYNRYIYKSEYHISREILETYNEGLVHALDNILFKGKTHLKRGNGFTTIPEKLLKCDDCRGLNIKKEIQNVFINYFREKKECIFNDNT